MQRLFNPQLRAYKNACEPSTASLPLTPASSYSLHHLAATPAAARPYSPSNLPPPPTHTTKTTNLHMQIQSPHQYCEAPIAPRPCSPHLRSPPTTTTTKHRHTGPLSQLKAAAP